MSSSPVFLELRLDLPLLVLLELPELRPQPLQLGLSRLEPVLYRFKLLRLDHAEGLVLQVHVSLLILALVAVSVVLPLLLLLLDLLSLRLLEGVQGARIDEAVRVVLFGRGCLKLRRVDIHVFVVLDL